MADLKDGRLRLIGDPDQRFREDPVRMLRAVRFAAKLGFEMDEPLTAALLRGRERLLDVAPARLYEEVVKLFLGGAARQSFSLLRQHGLFALLFPDVDACLEDGGGDLTAADFVVRALGNTDVRVAEDKPVTPAFLFAALLWPALEREARAAHPHGEDEAQAEDEAQVIESAGARAIARQVAWVSLPRRCSVVMREIWGMQPKLLRYRGRRALGLLASTRFRAGYDLLLLRAQADEALRERCDWWTESRGRKAKSAMPFSPIPLPLPASPAPAPAPAGKERTPVPG